MLETKIAELETHIIYIREKVDSLASKRELNIHRFILAFFGTLILFLFINFFLFLIIIRC